MKNNYSAPDVVEVGRASDVILGIKWPDFDTDSFGVPFSTEPDNMDDAE